MTHEEADAARVGETVGEDETEICPVCGESLKAEDMCATDIELGICHAACLDGTPTIYLDTGEPSEGPIDTYRHGDVASSPASEPAPQVVKDDLKKASWALYYAVQDIDLGRSVHNSRKPDQPIDGPLWKTLMKAASELHEALSPTPPTLSTDADGKEG